jgi:hypothetical protein
MSHPAFLKQAFEKRECRERSVPAGVWRVHEKLFFPLFFAAAGREKKKRRGHPADPGKGLAAPCNPAWEADRTEVEPMFAKCGMTHVTLVLWRLDMSHPAFSKRAFPLLGSLVPGLLAPAALAPPF